MAINTQNIGAGQVVTLLSANDLAVTFVSVCNFSAATVSIDIHIVKNGDLVGTDNLFISALEIVANDTYVAYQGNEKLFLETGDQMVVVASIPNVTTVITSYVGI